MAGPMTGSAKQSSLIDPSGGRVFTLSLKELSDWRGNRADAGRLAPKGFPKNNKLGGEARLSPANGKGAGE